LLGRTVFSSSIVVGSEVVGYLEGALEGIDVGLLEVGRTDGCPVGCIEGVTVGWSEGWRVGCEEGPLDGCVDGCLVGTLLGCSDGEEVG